MRNRKSQNIIILQEGYQGHGARIYEPAEQSCATTNTDISLNLEDQSKI